MRLPKSFLDRPLAHRGLHDASKGIIENTASAFLAAIDHGFGIELDLQLSSDAQAMVFHDYDMERLTGRPGPIQTRPHTELGRIGLSGGTDHINTLREILDLVAGRVPLLIELKDQDGAMGPNIGALEAATAEALKGYSGQAALMSFNPHSTGRLKELCPDLAVGIVTSSYDPADWPLSAKRCDELREIPDYDPSGATFISHEVTDLGRSRVIDLKKAGADILCWTVRSRTQEIKARQVAQNITFEGYLPD